MTASLWFVPWPIVKYLYMQYKVQEFDTGISAESSVCLSLGNQRLGKACGFGRLLIKKTQLELQVSSTFLVFN